MRITQLTSNKYYRPCRGIWNADRRTGKDSLPHQHKHDPSLREILRTAYRTGNAEDRRGVHRRELICEKIKINRALEPLIALMSGLLVHYVTIL